MEKTSGMIVDKDIVKQNIDRWFVYLWEYGTPRIFFINNKLEPFCSIYSQVFL